MSFAFSFFLALFTSWLLLPVLIRYSVPLKLMDYGKEERKAHRGAISRAGGIAIVVGSAVAILLSNIELGSAVYLLIAALVITVFGLYDDMYNLAYKWKFAGQIVAVLLVLSGGLVMHRLPLFGIEDAPLWLSYTVTFGFILGVTNAVNLSDGMDGLAGGSSLLSLALIAVLSYFASNYLVTILAIGVMGGISGFLRFNTNPAKVFMGDTGSQFIGFMAACLAVLCTQGPETAYSPALPLLIMGLPILDTVYVMAIRIINKRSPFEADRNHLHHRLARLNFSDREAVALAYLAQTIMMIFAYVLRYEYDLLIIASYLLLCAALVLSIIIAKRAGWQRHSKLQMLLNDPTMEKRNAFFRVFSDYFRDLSGAISYLIVVAFAIALVISFSGPTQSGFPLLSAAAALFNLLLYLISRNKRSARTVRITTSSCAAILLFAAINASPEGALRYLLDGYLLLLILSLILCVRITRHYRELLNTQDFLILCFLVLLAVLPIARDDLYLFLRIAAIVYAVEFLISVSRVNYKLLNFSSIFFLAAAAILSAL